MLTGYRRHSPKCKYESMSEKRCHCPLCVNGTIDGKLIRQSLKTMVWDVGQKKVREWEAAGKTAGAQGREMRGEIEEVLAFTLVDMALRTESLEGIENGACRVRWHGEADAGEDSAGSCRRDGRSCTLIQSD